jgi:hypothetical protein
MEGKEEDVSSYFMTLRRKRILETDRGSTRSQAGETSLWKNV